MSVAASGEQNIPGTHHAYKCRIPQRLQTTQSRITTEKNKPVNFTETMYTRPKSASRAREDSRQTIHPTLRSARTDHERLWPTQKKIAAAPRRSTLNENLSSGNKATKDIITVPITGKQKHLRATKNTLAVKNYSTLPDQETIKQCEDLESQQNNQNESPLKFHSGDDLDEKDSITNQSEKITQLKIYWQEMKLKFQNMKSDLNERQEAILKLYASLLGTHQKLHVLGHKLILPPSDELRIMNVAKLSPDQLIQLCSESKRTHDIRQITHNPINIYINKMRDNASKLIALCEETLVKRKEIIDWFDTLKNQGCKLSSLKKKINEYNSENEMLNDSLNSVKSDFVTELNDVVDIVSKCVNEAVALQLRTEEMNCALSDINSKNTELRKQMYTAEQSRSLNNKSRIMELEKMLKEEKLTKATMKERLARAEGQVKIGEERAVQLEAALNQTRLQIRKLERTVQQLREENHKLQIDFDKELSKLNESIKENTTHLEEIGDAREKLQTEKEDLEKRLEELSNYYNESLDYFKDEQNRNVAKAIEIEKKYNEELEERKKRDTQIETLCTRLVEAELGYKDTATLLQEHKSLLGDKENELQCLRNELDKRKEEVEEQNKNLEQQNKTIREIEKKLGKSIESEEKLKCELDNRDTIISEFKLRQQYLEQQLETKDFKMNQYEKQLTSLKSHIEEFNQRWTAIEHFSHLPEMLSEQEAKMVEITHQNNDLLDTLDKKNIELKNYIGTIKEQEEILKQKEDTIRILSDKEEEQENIIRLLKNNLEMRTHVDSEVNQQLAAKNSEIDSLLNNLEKNKQHINQLEKIILSLEDKVQKSCLQKRKDEEKMCLLEKRIAKYEAYRTQHKKETENPADNLDNLIKILEEELNSPIEVRNLDTQKNNKRYNFKHQQQNDIIFQNTMQCDDYFNEHDTVPTKIEMGNFVRKTYVPNKNGLNQVNNIESNNDDYGYHMQKCIPFSGSGCVDDTHNKFVPSKKLSTLTKFQDYNVNKNIHNILSNNFKDEKKRKMLKFVRHRL